VKLATRRNGYRAARVVGAAVMLFAGSLPVRAQTSASGADDSKWHFALTPYVFGMSAKGTMSFKGIPEQPVEASFGDILSNLNFGFLGRTEGRKGNWGFTTDLLYMNLGARIPVGDVLGRFEPEVDGRQFAAEATAFRRVYRSNPAKGAPGYVDVLAGARYNRVSAQLEGSSFDGTRQSLNWVDALAGVRFAAPLGSKVALAGRGDLGGFGSDLTWQLEGDLWLHLSPRWALGAGYRYIDTDYDKGSGRDRKVWKMVDKGPVVSAVYGW
jgi:hypothetical protein